jgi:hypothetical protein
MRTVHQFVSALVLLAVLSVAAGQDAQTTTLPVGSATVAEFKGEVSLHSPQGAEVTPQRGSVLEPESVIETRKGSMLLNLSDGSQVLVKPQSHVVLKSPNEGKGYYLELLIGRVLAKVRKHLGESPSFRMGTPTAVITVRGTKFGVHVTNKQRTYVEVFDGVVEVAGFVMGTPPVLLHPGFSTGVEPNRAPEPPRSMHDQSEDMGVGGERGRGDNDSGDRGTGGRTGGSQGDRDREGSGQQPPPSTQPSGQHRDD